MRVKGPPRHDQVHICRRIGHFSRSNYSPSIPRGAGARAVKPLFGLSSRLDASVRHLKEPNHRVHAFEH
jgi:hypothetical protein